MNTASPIPGPAVVQEISKQTAARKSTHSSKARHKPERDNRPTKILPTERITFDRQLDLLRAYAAASANGTKSVSLEDVGAVVKMATTTISVGNPFLNNIGLISKTDAGFMPAPEVISFLRAYEWTPATASNKLAPIIEGTWFFKALLPLLMYRPLEEEAALTHLGESASAGPEYKRNLQILIEYMIAAGLVQREGNQLKLGRQSASPSPENQTARAEPSKPTDSDASAKNRVSTVFAKTTEGAVHFNVSVKVDMEEFAGWQADRIAAFFSGIAEVLKAKANVESET